MKTWRDRNKAVPAVYLMLEKDGKILLLKRAGSTYMNGFYGLVSGHVERGEAPTEAMVRECEEEVSIKLKPEDVEIVHIMYYVAFEGDHERISFLFKAKEYQGEPQNMEPEMCSELRWESLDSMPENLVPEVKNFFAGIKQNKFYSEPGYKNE